MHHDDWMRSVDKQARRAIAEVLVVFALVYVAGLLTALAIAGGKFCHKFPRAEVLLQQGYDPDMVTTLFYGPVTVRGNYLRLPIGAISLKRVHHVQFTISPEERDSHGAPVRTQKD